MGFSHVFVSVLSLTASLLLVFGQAFKPLGSHSKPSTGAKVLYGKFPPPTVFYNHFVKTGEPLLMKNVLNETDYELYQTWTDEYLSDRYGDGTIEIEKTLKENRALPRSKLKFSKFLALYQKIDMYMINVTSRAMQGEVTIPFTLQCGGFQNVLQDVYVWLSNGNTRSTLHYDVMDNIHCLLDGQKTIVLIDRIQQSKVEGEGFVQNGRYSQVDVDDVDPDMFPGVAQAPWAQIRMKKGDCAFIPYKWYHHIRSPPGRNLAINFWFSHLLWFNKTDCEDVDHSTPFKPIRHFQLASSNEYLRTEIFSLFENLDGIKKSIFYALSSCTKEDNDKLWKLLNSNSDGKLSWEEIYSIDIDELVSKAPECFQKLVNTDKEVQTVTSTVNGNPATINDNTTVDNKGVNESKAVVDRNTNSNVTVDQVNEVDPRTLANEGDNANDNESEDNSKKNVKVSVNDINGGYQEETKTRKNLKLKSNNFNNTENEDNVRDEL